MAKNISKKTETAAIAAAIAANPDLVKKVPAKVSKKALPATPVAPAQTAEAPKVRVAWNAGKVVVHHAVKVGKTSFPSTWKAFEGTPELATLSRGAHIRFRKNLKAAPGGKLDFVHPVSKKVYPFELVAE